MDKIQSILYYVSASALIIATVLGFFTGKSRIKKVTKQIQDNNDEDQNDVEEVNPVIDKLSKIKIVLDKVASVIIDAESTGMVGKAKKMYVISCLIQECCKVDLNYNEIAVEAEAKIEELIDLSKKVNAKEIKEENVTTIDRVDF